MHLFQIDLRRLFLIQLRVMLDLDVPTALYYPKCLKILSIKQNSTTHLPIPHPSPQPPHTYLNGTKLPSRQTNPAQPNSITSPLLHLTSPHLTSRPPIDRSEYLPNASPTAIASA